MGATEVKLKDTPPLEAPAPADATPPALLLEGVTKHYGDVRALEDVNLAVRPGEILGLLGPNGAGKSTTIHLMLGLLKPTRGRVRVFGVDPVVPENRIHLGAMVQNTRLPPRLRVGEIIELFSSYYPAPFSLKETVAMAELQGFERRMMNALSSGERQRVRFALAICGNPEVVLLDEPTVNLDVEARRRFWGRIREIASARRTIVLTTHYLEEADALANLIVLIHKGRLLMQGAPRVIKAHVDGQHVTCITRMAVNDILAIPGVKKAQLSGEWMEIVAQPEIPIARELYQRDPDLKGLTVKPVGLEEAFFEIISRENKS
ncbi:MAG: ABC transporter ATP-binding protein [Hyalangium sp.]|uniref:ABC transporter ATP-binding protein n=1 Tax=Hyalangium sp. TaxID=2028555 RepID=UPI00389AAA4A